MIPKLIIDIKAIAEIPFGVWSRIHDSLDGFLGAISENLPT
jgi:hypothetical protein